MQQLLDGFQERIQIDRLLQETGGADVEGKFLVFRGHVGGGDEHHRDVAGLGIEAQAVDKPKPVQFWHHNIGDHNRRAVGAHKIQPFPAVAGCDHAIAFECQRCLE